MRSKKRKQEKENVWVFVLTAMAAWRAWCFVFLFLGLIFLPEQRNFLGGGGKYLMRPEMWAWANFDGEHYLRIAQHGYGNLDQAFFPLYPYLVRWFGGAYWSGLKSLLISGLLISHVSLYLGLVFFYKLVRLDRGKKIARWSVLALLVAPTSFFFGAVYTEALFLALVVGSFLAARQRRWWLAGILGGLASATRVVGIVVFLALVVEWLWQRSKEKARQFWALVPISFSCLGLLFYMRFLSVGWGDPLYFIHAQPAFGAGRSVDKMVLLYQVFWRYAKMVFTVDPYSVVYYTVQLELGAALLFLLLVVISAFKQRWSYAVFAGLAYVIPTLTGTFLSLPRFVLILFPAFILLGGGLAKNKVLRWGYLGGSLVLFGVTTALFTRGFWVG